MSMSNDKMCLLKLQNSHISLLVVSERFVFRASMWINDNMCLLKLQNSHISLLVVS